MRVRKVKRSTWQRMAMAAGVAVVITTLSSLGLSAGVFQGFQNQASDNFFPTELPSDDVVVVGVDDRSLREVPESWPWPRAHYGRVTAALLDAGADVVAFDVVLDPPRPEDTVLAEAMRKGKVVVAASTENDLPLRRFGARRIVEMTPPSPVVVESAAALAHVNVLPDPDDGVVRALPVVLDAGDYDLPSLSLAAVMAKRGIAPDTPMTLGPKALNVGDLYVMTEEQQTLLVNFADALRPNSGRAFISAADVLAGTFDPTDVKGKIVLFGAAAPILGDNRLTPVDKENIGIPGVFIHANAANTMLHGAFVTPATRTETLAWVFCLALFVALLTLVAPLWMALPIPAVLAAVYLVWAFAQFETGFVMNVVYPLLAIVLALIAGQGVRYLTEGRHRRRVSALFSQYVPPTVAQRLVEEGRVDSVLEGERAEISVLFCDLRGFTAYAAKAEPAQVHAMLETYYLRLGEVILDHGGTLMQYVGDEIYAIFGAPLPDPDHRQKALDCALAMQAARPEMGDDLKGRDLAPIFYGIGLNAGTVVVAHVGSRIRRQYSAIGDTVNIGSRLCSEAREDQICFTEEFRSMVDQHPTLVDMGPIEFKNATRPLQVWKHFSHTDRDDAGNSGAANTGTGKREKPAKTAP